MQGEVLRAQQVGYNATPAIIGPSLLLWSATIEQSDMTSSISTSL